MGEDNQEGCFRPGTGTDSGNACHVLPTQPTERSWRRRTDSTLRQDAGRRLIFLSPVNFYEGTVLMGSNLRRLEQLAEHFEAGGDALLAAEYGLRADVCRKKLSMQQTRPTRRSDRGQRQPLANLQILVAASDRWFQAMRRARKRRSQSSSP